MDRATSAAWKAAETLASRTFQTCSYLPHNLACPAYPPTPQASLSLACKGLYAAVLSAGGLRCKVNGCHLASFGAWLQKLHGAGGCAGLAVQLWDCAGADDALAALSWIAAVGLAELHVDWMFTLVMDCAQLKQAIKALGAGVPCRLRTLRISPHASTLHALNALTTVERLECCDARAAYAWQWHPNMQQLTALVVQTRNLKLSLDGVPALRQLTLECSLPGATVAASAPLGGLTALRFSGGALSFPWEQACGLEELALTGNGTRPPFVPGTRHLSALMRLRLLALPLPAPGRAANQHRMAGQCYHSGDNGGR